MTDNLIFLKIIHTWLDYQFRWGNFPGFQVCIRKDSHLIYNKAFGYQNNVTQAPLSVDHYFRIASHSKTFTATAFLILSDHGKISLNDPVLTYLPPALRQAQGLNFKEMTILDLLSHRSGIFRDGMNSHFWDLFSPFPTKKELIEKIDASASIFPPHQQVKYSNIGYGLLGVILETILDMPYKKALQNLVLRHIEGDFHVDYDTSLYPQMSYGHSPLYPDHVHYPLKHVSAKALAPAAGLCAHAADTNLFFDRLLVSKDLFSDSLHNKQQTMKWSARNAPNDQYGLGLLFSSFSEGQLVGHRGGYPGFSTYTGNWSNTGYTFSFFLNTNDNMPIIAVQSMAFLISIMKKTFSEEELMQVQLSPLLVSGLVMGWGSLFVVGRKKAICLNLTSWSLESGIVHLHSHDAETYFCEEQSAYAYLGEKITFCKNQNGQIESVQWGPATFSAENIFLKKVKESFVG